MSVQVAKKRTQVHFVAHADDVEHPFLLAAQGLIDQDKASGRTWLAALRERALERFKSTGLPHRRLEAWRYTDLRAQLGREFSGVVPRDVSGTKSPDMCTIMFIDGVYRPDLSSISSMKKCVDVVSLRDVENDPPDWIRDQLSYALDDDNRALVAFNTALMNEGVFIRVGAGVTVDQPIYLSFIVTGESIQSHTRVLILLEKNACATVVETHGNQAAGCSFVDAMTTLYVDEGAQLRHYKHQRDNETALHMHTLRALLSENSTLDSFYLTTGVGFSRTDGVYDLSGKGADLQVNGAYLLSGTQHGDTTTEIIHRFPDCTSREVFHGVLFDKARGVFQGRILVNPDAQRTDGHQMSRALLLSDYAKADAKPELQIYADDVKCSHGATAGELDGDALFYLRSRGLTLPEAKALLAEAFVNQTLEEILDEDTKASFKKTASQWISKKAAFLPERSR